MGGLTSMFESPSKQAQQVASANQGLVNQTFQQAKQYANQAGTNTQNAIAAIGPNPYFGAGSYLSPSAYTVNPNDTTTFGQTPAPGNFTGTGFQFSTPLAQSDLQQNGPLSLGMKTQPVAINPNAQDIAVAPAPQSSGTQDVAPVASNNPFSNGRRNTAAIASLFGL